MSNIYSMDRANSVINDFQIMMNALRICTHATQTLIVLTLLVHTPVNVEMVILAMVAYVQVISGAFQIYFDTPIMSQLVFISDIFRYANYVIAGICYIIVCLWKHHVNLLQTIICFIAMQTYKELVYVMFY